MLVIINERANYCPQTGYIHLRGWPDIQIEEIVPGWEGLEKIEIINLIKDFLES